MKLWKDFLDDLLPQVPGCPQPMAEFHLRRAAQEFCERTLCWREWLVEQETAGDDLLEFLTDDKQEVVLLLNATLAGRELPVLTPGDLPATWRSGDSSVQGIVTLDRVSFYLLPTPIAGLEVKTEVALKPSNKATGVTDEVYRHYVAQIALGAAARLHATAGVPYANPNSTARAEFERAVAETASAIDKAHSRAANRVRAHFI